MKKGISWGQKRKLLESFDSEALVRELLEAISSDTLRKILTEPYSWNGEVTGFLHITLSPTEVYS